MSDFAETTWALRAVSLGCAGLILTGVLVVTALELSGRASRVSTSSNESLPELVLPVRGIGRDDLANSWGDPRSGGRSHSGIDIHAPRGAVVVAVASGTIEKLDESDRGGVTVHQFDASGRWSFYYAHLDRYARGLEEGQKVEAGDVIGYVGTTGNAPSSAPHLHFEIRRLPASGEWWLGEAIDPTPWLRR